MAFHLLVGVLCVGILASDWRRLRTEKHLLPLAFFILLLWLDLLSICGLGTELLKDILDIKLAGRQWLTDRVLALLVRGGGHFGLRLVCGYTLLLLLLF